jgi:hypothetical protein
VVVEEVVLLAARALDDGDGAAGVVVDGLAGVVAVPEPLGAARTHVGADAGVDVECAEPAAADLHALYHAVAAAHHLNAVGLVGGLLAVGGLRVEGVELLALLAEGAGILAQRTIGGTGAAAPGGVPLAAARSASALAVVHEGGVGLVLGVVEVHVGHHARVLRTSAAHERADRGQERVGDGLQLTHHRAEPTSGELETVARANGIPFPRRERGRPWSGYVREWMDRRREQGLPVPDGPPPKRQRPDYTHDVGAARPGERRGRKQWDDLDEFAAWVLRYLDALPRGERPGQRDYDGWGRRTEGAPWSSNFGPHGGWTVVLARSREMRDG